MVYPRSMNHVGITVTDIDAAVKWYRELFGCTVVMAPRASADGTFETATTCSINYMQLHRPFTQITCCWLE